LVKRVALFLSVLLLLLAIPVTVFAARALVPVPEDTSPIDELMAGPAGFTLSQLEAAQDKILDIFSRNKIPAMVSLNSKANTLEIYAPEENGDLNVNGACYRVQPAAREAFEKNSRS
jgi:hypothetical protein